MTRCRERETFKRRK